jgi:Flp pilus assembly protein CpaB
VALAVATAGVVARATADAEAARARYGETRPVVVVERAVPAGHRLGDQDVAVVDVPAGLVPDDAVSDLPAGSRTRAALVRGEMLVAARLTPDALGEVAARLPADTVGLAVPVDTASLRLDVGDRVDLLATFDPAAAGGDDPTFAVATAAPVVDVSDTAATVAVPRADATRVAFALVAGVVTPALTAG